MRERGGGERERKREGETELAGVGSLEKERERGGDAGGKDGEQIREIRREKRLSWVGQ